MPELAISNFWRDECERLSVGGTGGGRRGGAAKETNAQSNEAPLFPQPCGGARQPSGRMRLYMPAVSDARAQAEQMKTQLESTGIIRRVDIEPRTGSVLILYDEAAVQAPVVMGAAMKLMGLDEKASAVPAGKLREGLRTLMSAINAGVLDATGGLVDAKTLAAGILTVAALRSRAKIGWAMPGALTLLWWASGLLGAHGYE